MVIKHRYCGFVGTELELILRSRRIETLVVTGTATNGCVESTVRDAYQRDFWTVTVSDCIASASLALHEGALRSIDWSSGLLATSYDIVYVWNVAELMNPMREVPTIRTS